MSKREGGGNSCGLAVTTSSISGAEAPTITLTSVGQSAVWMSTSTSATQGPADVNGTSRWLDDSTSISPRHVYNLSLQGLINIDDGKWTEELRSAIVHDDLELCEALLCCGIPMTPLFFQSIPLEQDDVRQLCAKFCPDIWTSIKTGNVKQVRCLVNLWHKVDLVRNGKSLFQLAIEHSNPYIISLIGGIQTTMEVAHVVLAGDVKRLHTLRPNGQFIKRTLKHFGHNCAPILYFAIIHNNIEMVQELCQHFGMKSDDLMLDQDGQEIPLLFVALQSAVDHQIITVLLQSTHYELTRVWYQKRNILQYSLDIQVSADCFALLLECGGGQLVAERDATNRTLTEVMAELPIFEAQSNYKAILEKQIQKWIREKNKQAVWLAILGFQSFFISVERNLCIIQEHVADLAQCITDDDAQRFEMTAQLLHSTLPDDFPISTAVWYARPPGKPQSLLHRAVICGRQEIVSLILSYSPPSSISTLLVPLDNLGVSPLHYACASSEYSQIEALLLTAGFSEHQMDKLEHDCASYRMKRDTADMAAFLTALAEGDFTKAVLLDPWDVDRVNADKDAEDLMEDLPYRKRVLTSADPDAKSTGRRKSSTHSHTSGRTSLGAKPDSWCSIS
ncbi:hypothetical protein RvY_18813 [Ramazzottius varieornatus]|uniref:Uncharacterized protein n=1 Tax=Ramazzottius varieornatus TaxID=947166 RepID=A0A1D1W749_RAMVA|nr:hypothetical protein RvY_18813 [Ramazzottius varieornatus]